MPIYSDIVQATRETVEKMLAARNIAGCVMIDCEGGATASMEKSGSTMVLHMPSFAPDTRLSRAEADRLVGYLAHEAAHQLHTHWPQWEAAAREGGFVRTLTNFLEDLRIERLEITKGPWGGFGAAVAKVINHHDETAQREAKQAGRIIGATAADLPWIVGLVGRQDNGMDIPGADKARAAVPAALRPILEKALRRARKTSSCEDCHKLAQEIARDLDQARQEAERNQAPGQDTGQDAGQNSNSPQSPQEGQGSQDTSKAGQDTGDNATGAQPSSERQDGANQDNQDSGDGEHQAQGAGLGGSADMFNKDGAGAAPSDNLTPDLQRHQVLHSHSVVTVLSANTAFRTHVSPWGMADGATVDVIRGALSRSALMQDQVTQLVASQEVRHRERRLSTGRFDRRGITRAAMGAGDVYARRTLTPGVDTAVLLLLDLSGSMGGARISVAKTMAIHLAEAIDMAGGKVAVLGFGTAEHGPDRVNGHGCQLLVFKSWDDSATTGARRICNAATPFGTPLSASLIAAARWMRGTVDADRYLLGALTDGDCAHGAAGVQAALKTVTSMDVEPFGLGCQYDTSDPFRGYPRADVFQLADLPKTAMRTLLRELQARSPQA